MAETHPRHAFAKAQVACSDLESVVALRRVDGRGVTAGEDTGPAAGAEGVGGVEDVGRGGLGELGGVGAHRAAAVRLVQALHQARDGRTRCDGTGRHGGEVLRGWRGGAESDRE